MTGLWLLALLLAAPGEEPLALAVNPAGDRVYVVEGAGRRVVALDGATGAVVTSAPLPAAGTGLALAGDRVWVTCGEPQGRLLGFDAALRPVATWPTGYGATAPVVSRDGRTVFVAARFERRVVAHDLATGRARFSVATPSEPVSAALTPDGRRLFVGHLLPAMAATAPVVAAAVTVIDVAAGKRLADVTLPDGATALRGLAASPDGQTVYVAHVLARYHQPTTQLERGWMNTNALTLLDAATGQVRHTVLLDEVGRGAANPWAVACGAAGAVLVTHAGTHELSVVDGRVLDARLHEATIAGEAADVPENLSFLLGARRRLPLPVVGPRALAVAHGRAWVAGYFSDSLAAVDLAGGQATEYRLGPGAAASPTRLGERWFSDGALCFQAWQSCVSCHPDARADGLNWDLINDGLGNPKNTRSMLLSHATPPSMSLGVRATAELAVRAGIRFIQYAIRPESDAVAIDTYLRALRPTPSPRLAGGKLSAAAQRGLALFRSDATGCATCHRGPHLTDQQLHDVGTAGPTDAGQPFDTPTLVELWRTGPYLHDGRAADLADVVGRANAGDRHGRTAHLSAAQRRDLAEYLESL